MKTWVIKESKVSWLTTTERNFLNRSSFILKKIVLFFYCSPSYILCNSSSFLVGLKVENKCAGKDLHLRRFELWKNEKERRGKWYVMKKSEKKRDSPPATTKWRLHFSEWISDVPHLTPQMMEPPDATDETTLAASGRHGCDWCCDRIIIRPKTRVSSN